jgi:predicted O-methyltransferase YrrM
MEIISPKYIIEVGTFTGYSALCLAEGLQENGELHTIEGNLEFQKRIERYFQESEFSQNIHLHIGQAKEVLPTLNYTWDLAFIDADKENYAFYYDCIIEKMQKGGSILIDNVWWSGKIIDEKQQDKKTKALREFNQKIKEDTRIEQIFLPFRDGLFWVRKL